MKSKLLWLLVLSSLYGFQNGYAQIPSFNRTYTDGGGRSVDIVNASNAGIGYSCVLGTSATYPIILKKLDFNGNVVFDHGITMANTVHPSALLYTPNDEYIVVGSLNTGSIIYPFAARFNSTGNMLWFKCYNTISGIMESNTPNIKICRVEDDGPDESYILVCTAIDPYRIPGQYGSGLDYYPMALRFDGATGTATWNKVYSRTGAPANDWAYDVRELTRSVCFINDNNPRYFIGGSTETWATTPLTGTGSFFMSIDKNGGIVDGYNYIGTTVHWYEDALYDNATQQIVLCYLAGNVCAGITVSASAIGISKFNTAGGLTHVRSDFYAMNPCIETYPMGMQEDATHRYYVVGAAVYPYSFNDAKAYWNMANFRVDKTNPNNVSFFNRFNIQRESYTASMIDLVDGPRENYVIAGSIPPAVAGGNDAMRVISTEVVNGQACGWTAVPWVHTNPSFTVTPVTYSITDQFGETPYTGVDVFFPGNYTFCTPSGGSYRTAPSDVNDVANLNSLRVYPTVLFAEKQVSIDFNVDVACTLDACILSLDGKVISRQVLHSITGANHLAVDMNEFTTGTYLLRLSTSDGAINKIFKLSRL